MTQTIYDTLQGISPQIITVGRLLENCNYNDGGGEGNDDNDLFQCGKCKKQFHSFGTFVHHKKTHQLGNNTVSQSVVCDTGNDQDLQLQPIILSETDILSFNISQDELTLSNNDEVTNEESIEGLILPVTSLVSSPMLNMVHPITYIEKDQIVVAENVTENEDLQKEYEEYLQNKAEEEAIRKKKQRIKEAKLKCPYCLKQFTKQYDLEQHLRIHTGERPFQCIVCGRSFTQKSNIKKHMATHKSWPHSIRTLPEKPIQKIFTPSSGVTVVVDESFVCQYCPEIFNSKVLLKAHLKTHVNNKIFKCVQKNCYAVFETLEKFLEHTAAHLKEGSNAQYRCFHCRQSFHSLDELSNHQRLNVPCRKKKPSSFMCKLCKSKFNSVEALERHQIEDSHSYLCSECNKVFVSEKHLRRHLKSHSSILPFPCSECGKSFKTAQNLSVHKLVHSSERPYACKFCSATFARQDRLVRHNFIHDPTRRYKCPFSKHVGCKMEFYRKDKLKQHILTHSSNKSLKCLRCNRMFKRNSQLRRHETVCLSEDKPCKDCGHVTTSLDHYKKNTTVSKEHSHVNRRKHRLLESSKKSDDGVPTIQVIVVPLGGASGEQIENESGS